MAEVWVGRLTAITTVSSDTWYAGALVFARVRSGYEVTP